MSDPYRTAGAPAPEPPVTEEDLQRHLDQLEASLAGRLGTPDAVREMLVAQNRLILFRQARLEKTLNKIWEHFTDRGEH